MLMCYKQLQYLNILVLSWNSVVPWIRGFWITISANIHPMDHTSAEKEYLGNPRRISGALQDGDTFWKIESQRNEKAWSHQTKWTWCSNFEVCIQLFCKTEAFPLMDSSSWMKHSSILGTENLVFNQRTITKWIGSFHWCIINFMKTNLLSLIYWLENRNPAYPNVWCSNNIWITGKKIPMANREFQLIKLTVCFFNKKFLSLPFQHLLVSLCNCSDLSALDEDSSVHVYIWSNGITRYHGESDSEGPARIGLI